MRSSRTDFFGQTFNRYSVGGARHYSGYVVDTNTPTHTLSRSITNEHLDFADVVTEICKTKMARWEKNKLYISARPAREGVEWRSFNDDDDNEDGGDLINFTFFKYCSVVKQVSLLFWLLFCRTCGTLYRVIYLSAYTHYLELVLTIFNLFFFSTFPIHAYHLQFLFIGNKKYYIIYITYYIVYL